jgi:hypothetical protein
MTWVMTRKKRSGGRPTTAKSISDSSTTSPVAAEPNRIDLSRPGSLERRRRTHSRYRGLHPDDPIGYCYRPTGEKFVLSNRAASDVPRRKGQVVDRGFILFPSNSFPPIRQGHLRLPVERVRSFLVFGRGRVTPDSVPNDRRWGIALRV